MTTHENGTDRVQALVTQREQIRAWIAKLDEVRTGAPSHVTERVRADYEDRLRRVDEELSAHGEEIQRNLEALRQQLAAAEERRAAAADALEETRLRHLIGELDEAAWDHSRAPLEHDVNAAEEAVSAARGEVERLSALAEGISGAPAADDEQPQAEATADVGFNAWETTSSPPVPATEEDDGEDFGDDLPFLSADDEPAPAAEAQETTSGAGDWEPELEFAGDADSAPAKDAAPAAPNPVSGAELAAWISEVESETVGEPPAAETAPPAQSPSTPTADEVDAWDPFANEFGGAPAAPTTQPGDATSEDLPWLKSLQEGGAGKWNPPADTPADDLAFLDNLETPAPTSGAQPAGADLAADDLAFLEELDRAISGGGGTPRAAQPAAPAPGGFGNSFQGGSGGNGGIISSESTQEQPAPRKRGEALLCKECGAINEPQAWYCEICGSEL